MIVWGVTGWKNAGKTTLVEGLLRALTARGLTVSTLKHSHHGFDVDQPGRDSHRHREAGAAEVLVASSLRWALMRELREAAEPSLTELLARLSPCDVVLVEGWKREAHSKIEAWRPSVDRPPLACETETVKAVATPGAVASGAAQPHLDLDAPEAIADFLISADAPA
ncbi:MAG: molybdopterin-guanine dinucleotide biosynthesis protein B [Pseudomonadota bacterium]